MKIDPTVSRLDRMRGLLLGGAIGDALGAPVEFMDLHAIRARFGLDGITDFAEAYGRTGAITDDTQMTLFTLEGLIRAAVRWRIKGICHPPSVVDHAYRRWLASQQEPYGDALGYAPSGQPLDGWLIREKALWASRSPGATCLSALRTKLGGALGEPAINNSKGAGGIMRVGVAGLLVKSPYEMGRDLAALTHGHGTGQVAAGWFAATIAGLAKGKDFALAGLEAWEPIRGLAPELDQMLACAVALAEAPARVVPALLGEGWVAEEAGAIALWCLMTADSPLEALRLAVNIDGDSDTTGTLVGQALGAALGISWAPQSWLDALELRDVMETLAADAVAVDKNLTYDGTPSCDRFWERYPGW